MFRVTDKQRAVRARSQQVLKTIEALTVDKGRAPRISEVAEVMARKHRRSTVYADVERLRGAGFLKPHRRYQRGLVVADVTVCPECGQRVSL